MVISQGQPVWMLEPCYCSFHPLSWREAVKEAMTAPQPHQSVHDNSLSGILSVHARDKFSSIANGFLAMLAHVQLVFKCQG